MKKLLVMGCLLLGSVQAFGKASSTITLTSDFIFRGVTSGNGAAVQGSIDYALDNGVVLGAWASNSAFNNYEFDQYIGYSFGEEMMNLNVTLFNYYYPQLLSAKSQELILSTAISGAKIQLAYMPKFFGAESTSIYANVGYGFQIAENLTLAAAVGYTSFGDEKKTVGMVYGVGSGFETQGTSSYMDYKLSLQYSNEGWTTDIGWTNHNAQAVDTTTGTKTDTKINNEKTYVSISKTF